MGFPHTSSPLPNPRRPTQISLLQEILPPPTQAAQISVLFSIPTGLHGFAIYLALVTPSFSVSLMSSLKAEAVLSPLSLAPNSLHKVCARYMSIES